MACCIDPKCRNHALGEAMRNLPGVEIQCLCSGHGVKPFKLWFRSAFAETVAQIAAAAYGIGAWRCDADPHSGDLFLLESVALGDEAYEQSERIAVSVKETVNDESREQLKMWLEGERARIHPITEPEDAAGFIDFEQQCFALIAAINKMPGLRTKGSCWGHGHMTFRIWFFALDVARY